MNEFWDRLGLSASLLCMIHCLATPVLVVFLPLASEIVDHNWFHWVILIIAIPSALLALWSGYKIHHAQRPLWLGVTGLALMIFAMARSERWWEIVLMVGAGALLSTAHLLNLRICRSEKIRH